MEGGCGPRIEQSCTVHAEGWNRMKTTPCGMGVEGGCCPRFFIPPSPGREEGCATKKPSLSIESERELTLSGGCNVILTTEAPASLLHPLLDAKPFYK